MLRLGRAGLMGIAAVMLLVSGCQHCCKHPWFARRSADGCPPRGGDPYLPPVAPAPPPPGVGAAPPPGAIGGPGPSADLVVPGPAVNGRAPAYYYPNGRGPAYYYPNGR